MEQISEQHLNALRQSHGDMLGITQALRAVPQGQYVPSEDLLNAVRSLPADVSYSDGSTPNGYIFGSAKVHTENNVSYQKYTQQLVDTQDKFVTIADTRGSQLIENFNIQGHLENSLLAEGSPLEADDVLQGYMENGTRQPGLWDDISRGFAENAHGDVITVTPHASPDRVFVQTELPALLDNPNVNSINGLPRETYVDKLNEIVKALPEGAPMSDAYTQLNRNFVQHTSEAYMSRFSPLDFARDMDTTALDRDFIRAHEDLKPVLGAMEPPQTSMFKTAFNTASDFLKPAGRFAIQYGGPAVLFMAIGMDSAEAAELETKLSDAVQDGSLDSEAVQEYQAILAGHVGKNFDPTPISEIGVQLSYDAWANEHNVDPSLREALRPSSLVREVGEASVDIAFYGADQAYEGAIYAADGATRSLDHVSDSLTGNLSTREEIYNALPSVDVQAATDGTLTGDHASFNDRDDILDLLQSKARAEYFEGQLKTEEDPDRQAYFAERLQAEKDSFEVSVEAMDEDQLSDVQDTLATYNQYVDGSTSENVVIADEGTTPTNPELLGSQPAATTNRIGM